MGDLWRGEANAQNVASSTPLTKRAPTTVATSSAGQSGGLRLTNRRPAQSEKATPAAHVAGRRFTPLPTLLK